MFVSGKFRNGYVVFRKICNFFISCSSAFLLLRNVCVREIPRRVCVFWKVYNFFVFPFLSRSSASPLSCSSVFQPPFFVLFPLFLYFYIFLSMYKKTPLSLCWRQSVGCLIKGKGVFFRIYISSTVWNRKMSWCFALKVSKINLCVETGPILRRPFWRKGSNIQEAEIYIGRIQMLTEIRPKFAVSGISRLSRGRK